MRRRILATLLGLFGAVLATVPPESVRPMGAAGQRLYLPIAARNAIVHRQPLTQWTTFARTRFNDLDVDANGVAFASTDDGVLRWDSVSGEHRWLTEAEGVPAGAIGALAVDRTGGLWLAAKPTETVADADATTGVRRLAADGTWQAFTTADGLAGNAVYAIEVDHEGRVWVAAWHGVSRREADGTWTTVRALNPSLNCGFSDCVHAMLSIAFGGGVVWFGHAAGVSRLGADGGWRQWAVGSAPPYRRIAADRRGNGWIIADRWGKSLSRIDSEGMILEVDANKPYRLPMSDLVVDDADRLWVGGKSTVESLGTDGRWRTEGGPSGLPTDGLRRLTVDPSGRVWAALGGVLTRVVDDGPTLLIGLPPAVDRVRAIAPAPDGSVWLGVDDAGGPLDGLVRISPDERFTSRGLQAGQPDLAGVRRVFFGADGTLWASDDQRLLRRGSDGSEIVHESRMFDPKAYFRDLVLDGDGTLWAAIGGNDESTPADGLALLHPDGRWEHVAAGQGGVEWDVRPLGFDGTRGELWLGDSGPKLTVRAADGSVRIVDPPEALGIGQTRFMVVDRDGGRWFVVGNYQLWFLSADGRWFEHSAELGIRHERHIDPVELSALAADPRGGIWCGTARGLVRLDVDGRWWRIAVPFADPDGTWQVVRALAFDAAGRLWMGTDAGVARLE